MAKFNGNGSEDTLQARARKFAAHLGGLTAVEREKMAATMPTVCNPSGHFLTVHNTMLLVSMSGRMDLTMVAGFRQWMDAGRCVKKGEHAVGCIMVPITLRQKDSAGRPKVDEAGNPKSDLRFRFVPVFDVSQTDALAAPVMAEGGVA